MIPAIQREALAVLEEVVGLAPDIRLGQLFAHLGFLGEDRTGQSLGIIEDEELLAVLYQHRSELAARTAMALPETSPPPGGVIAASAASKPLRGTELSR